MQDIKVAKESQHIVQEFLEVELDMDASLEDSKDDDEVMESGKLDDDKLMEPGKLDNSYKLEDG